MGRRGPSRSLFAALPPDLRNTIRTNGHNFSQNGLDLDSFQAKQELLDAGQPGPSSRLLRTQPASASPEIEEEESRDSRSIQAEVVAPVQERIGSKNGGKQVSLASGGGNSEGKINAEGESVRAVKRRRVEGAWVINAGPSTTQPRQKRRKGKELPVFNPYIGHPWDCTGLVERYVNRDYVPDDIKKCELPLWPSNRII